MKVGLCLGGGGSRGYAHLGAIRALTEAGIKIDIVNGTSIGAIIGGMYALYQNVDEMTALVKKTVDSVHVNHFNLFRHSTEGPVFLQNWLTEAVCDVAALSISIQSHRNNLKALRILFNEYRFEDTKIPFSAIATDIAAGETVIIKKGKLVDGVLASASIPAIFPPVARGKKLLVDGYVLANIPVPQLRQQGADFIISIELLEEPNTNYKNGVDLLYYVEYLKRKQLERWAIQQSDFHIQIDMSQFDSSHFENYIVAMERGYKTTQQVIPDLKEKLEKANV
jgi:NTE family protein